MSLFDRFSNIEEEYGLFDLEIDGIKIWGRVRYSSYKNIRSNVIGGEAQAYTKNSITNYILSAYRYTYNTLSKNPFFSKNRDYLIVGHSRRKKLSNGKWWDIYIDPILNKSELDFAYFEHPYLLNHKKPAETKRVKYLDIDNIVSNIPFVDNWLCKYKYNLSKLEYVDNLFKDEFSENVDIYKVLSKYLYRRKVLLPLYKKIIRNVNPDVLILVVAYSKSILIEAGKDLGVPVVELQHGVINAEHPGYSFPHIRHVPSFPDYFLTFGSYWTEGVDVPLPDDRIIPVGYPFLEFQKNQLEGKEQISESVIFISQRTIGERLSKVALCLHKSELYGGRILYKLHPAEHEDWRKLYPWLVDSGIEVVGKTDSTLHHIFTQSDAQVGVNSTALYEGMYFGLQTYLLEVPGYQLDQRLLNSEYAKKVSSAKHLANLLQKNDFSSETVDLNEMFVSHPFKKMCGTLEKILESGTVFEGGT